MDQIKLLRTFVVAEIVLTVVGVISESLLEGFLPQQLQAYLAADSEAPLRAHQVMALILGLPLLAAIVVAWIGILRFWRHAPRLYLVTCVGAFVVQLLAGPTVHTPLATAIDGAASLIAGVILGLLYFSQVRDRYGRRPVGVTVEGAA